VSEKGNWRGWLIALHRDVGYLCCGLTLVYAISGIAVNHAWQWDANRARETRELAVGRPGALLGEPRAGDPGRLARRRQRQLVARLVRALGRDDRPRKVFWRSPGRLALFFGAGDADVVDYLPARGVVEQTRIRERPLLRQLNFLHLNEPRSWWTIVADLYAALLLFLALSGAVVVRGRRGLRGRGALLLALGVLVPLLALWWLR